MEITGPVASLLAFFVLSASPGPATLAVATVSLQRGRRAGLLFGSGLAFGLAFWGVVAATGLGVILQGSVVLLTGLKILGGLYLLWLAFKSARSAMSTDEIPGGFALDRVFRTGVLLNLSNPKAVIAWMAALSVGVSEPAGGSGVLAATLLCMVCGGVIYWGYGLVFSARGAMGVYRRMRRHVDGLVAGIFAVSGLGLIRSALSRPT